MTELDLFDELTFLEDELILEAHELPARKTIRFRGLKRAAVIAAAVMMLVVGSAVASGDFGISRPRGWTPGSSETNYNSDPKTQTMTVRDEGIYTVDGIEGELSTLTITKAHKSEFSTEASCDGQQLQVIQEAMILMPDGNVAYKTNVSEGINTVIAVLDNQVDGELGEITHVRCTVAVLTEDTGDYFGRKTTPGPDGKVWAKLQGWSAFLPAQLHYDYPANTDFRFPDMQFNYDGRG